MWVLLVMRQPLILHLLELCRRILAVEVSQGPSLITRFGMVGDTHAVRAHARFHTPVRFDGVAPIGPGPKNCLRTFAVRTFIYS